MGRCAKDTGMRMESEETKEKLLVFGNGKLETVFISLRNKLQVSFLEEENEFS